MVRYIWCFIWIGLIHSADFKKKSPLKESILTVYCSESECSQSEESLQSQIKRIRRTTKCNDQILATLKTLYESTEVKLVQPLQTLPNDDITKEIAFLSLHNAKILSTLLKQQMQFSLELQTITTQYNTLFNDVEGVHNELISEIVTLKGKNIIQEKALQTLLAELETLKSRKKAKQD